VDVVGGILGILGLGGPVFALIEQQNYGWGHPVILLPLVLGLLCFAGFLLWESRTSNPMLPLGIFRSRNFSAGNVATVFVYGALSLGGLIVTVYLQQVAGFPATLAGLAFLPVSIANVLLSRLFGGLAGRYGPRLFMTVGPILGGVGYLLFLRMGEQVNYLTDVLPGVLLFSLGLSMTVAPLTSAVLGAIPARRSGIASAVNNAVSRVAGLIAIALLGLMLAGPLAVDNFHRVLVIIAAMFIVGGLVSLVGIRNPARAPSGQKAAAAERE
jgi:predicted MFS family arabinose efflux permease